MYIPPIFFGTVSWKHSHLMSIIIFHQNTVEPWINRLSVGNIPALPVNVRTLLMLHLLGCQGDVAVQTKGCLSPARLLAAHSTLVSQPIKTRRLKRRLSRVTKFIVCIIVKSPEEKQDRLLFFLLIFCELSNNIPWYKIHNPVAIQRVFQQNKSPVSWKERAFCNYLSHFSARLFCLDSHCWVHISSEITHTIPVNVEHFALLMHYFQQYSPML